MDREERTDAEMTIPGMRTSLFMVFAVRSRNCCRLRPDLMRTWTLGIDSFASSELLVSGKRMVLAAFAAAASNYIRG